MAWERDCRLALHWVAVLVLIAAPVVVLGATVGAGAPPGGAPLYILLVQGESTHYQDASPIFYYFFCIFGCPMG